MVSKKRAHSDFEKNPYGLAIMPNSSEWVENGERRISRHGHWRNVPYCKTRVRTESTRVTTMQKYTSEHIVIARAHYRPTARAPVCRGDRSVVSVFRTQCCGDHVKWLVELLNVLELELKDAIALDLFSGVRKDIRMRIKMMINAPETSRFSVRPRPCSEPYQKVKTFSPCRMSEAKKMACSLERSVVR